MTRNNDPNAVMLGANALLQTYRTISIIEHVHQQGEALDLYLPAINSLASFLRLVGCTLLSSEPNAPAQAFRNAQDELRRVGTETQTLISECLWTLLNAVHLLPVVPTVGADLLVFLGFAIDRLAGFEADQQVPAPGLFRFQPLAPADRLVFQTLYACACTLLPAPTPQGAVPDTQAWADLRLLWKSTAVALPVSSAATSTAPYQQHLQSIRLHLTTGTSPALATVEFCRHLNDADWKNDPLVRFWAEAVVQAIGTLQIQAPKSTAFKFFPALDSHR